MGIARGPNLVKDNLVFGYDTGYGVADNSTSTRFYPGESTTNNTIQTGYGWNGDGSNQSFANKGATTITDTSLKYNGYDTVLWTPGSSLNCYLNGSSDLNLNDNSTIWTFSCYIKRDDGAAISSLSVYLYYPNGDGSANGTIVDCGNGWYRVSRTRTGTSDNIGLAGFTGFISGHKYYLSGVMLTKNNHTVPYINVQSTRSSTQSLIDLTKSTNIDVSNVSFDSTGQPTFDGTDDYITLPNTSTFDINTQITVEAVVKYESTGGNAESYSVITCKGYPWNWLLENQGGKFNFRISTSNVSDSNINSQYSHGTLNYHHVIATYNGTTQAIYVNGQLKASKALTGTITTTASNIQIGCYTTTSYEHNGQIPVVKLYNRALSAQEIKQNFNAYKNRFNI